METSTGSDSVSEPVLVFRGGLELHPEQSINGVGNQGGILR